MPFTAAEERANALTHGLGLALGIVGVAVLMKRVLAGGSDWNVLGCGMYSASLLSVYAASTLSHALRGPRIKEFFAIVDTAVIYLLIAGTYTAFALHYLRGGWWWLLTAAIWGVAITGFLCKILRPDGRGPLSVSVYVLLGWLPAVAIKPLFEILPETAMWLIVAGGLWYTVGTIFIVFDEKVRYFHAVWHTFVVAGSCSHYAAIFIFVAN